MSEPGFVEWLRTTLYRVLVEHGVAAAAAERISIRFSDDVRGNWGGDRHYVARGIGPNERAERDELIRVEVLVNGKSIGWASQKFKLSRTSVRRICEPR